MIASFQKNTTLTVFKPQVTRLPRRAVVRSFPFLFTITTPFSTWSHCHTIDLRFCLFLIYTCINTCLWIWFIPNVLFRSSNTITSYKLTGIFWKRKKHCICFNLFEFFTRENMENMLLYITFFPRFGNFKAFQVSNAIPGL